MKTKLFLLLALISITVSAQLGGSVVSAPALEKLAVKDLTKTVAIASEAAQQTVKLKESLDLLQKAADAMEFVSEQLVNVNTTYNIMQSQARIIIRINNLTNSLADVDGLSPQVIQTYTNYMDMVMLSSQDTIKLMHQLLTTGIFKMEDGERLDFLLKIEESIAKEHDKLNKVEKGVNYLQTLNRYEKYLKE